jgi:hypothetical protein
MSRLADRELNLHNWVKTCPILLRKVPLSIERYFIRSEGQNRRFRQQIPYPTVGVCRAICEDFPFIFIGFLFQSHRHIGGRFAERRVENMRRNLAHNSIFLFQLTWFLGTHRHIGHIVFSFLCTFNSERTPQYK